MEESSSRIREELEDGYALAEIILTDDLSDKECTALMKVDRSAEAEEWEWAAQINSNPYKGRVLKPSPEGLKDLFDRAKRKEAHAMGIQFLGPM